MGSKLGSVQVGERPMGGKGPAAASRRRRRLASWSWTCWRPPTARLVLQSTIIIANKHLHRRTSILRERRTIRKGVQSPSLTSFQSASKQTSACECMSRQRDGATGTPVGIPQEGFGIVKHKVMCTRALQGACRCPGCCSGMSATS